MPACRSPVGDGNTHGSAQVVRDLKFVVGDDERSGSGGEEVGLAMARGAGVEGWGW